MFVQLNKMYRYIRTMYVLDIIVLQNSSTVTFATAATTRSTTTTTIGKRANVDQLFAEHKKQKNKKNNNMWKLKSNTWK